MGPIGFPETSVRNYHFALREIPKGRIFPLRLGGSLWSQWRLLEICNGYCVIRGLNIIIIKSIVPARNIGCLWVLSTSVYRLLRTLFHSSFDPLPWLPIFSSYFSVFLFPWGFQSRAAFGISPSSYPNVWPSHLNFLFLVSTFISSCPVTFHRSLLEIIFDHHILNICLRHLFTKVCILRWISVVTSLFSHPYKSTDFTQALNILILVYFHNDLG
jgi:hypothetical protein